MSGIKRDEVSAASELNVNDVHTILGPESSFEGKLAFEGTVRIDGRFKGEITTDNVLVIGQGARVEAQMAVGTVIINGDVVGDIVAKQAVEIHAPGRLRGNISTPQLTIAKGVIFEGTSKMEQVAGAPSNRVTLLSTAKEASQS